MHAPISHEPSAILDMTGQVCPHPLLGVRHALDGLRAGETLLLKSDCPGTRDDLFAWAARTGNEIVHSTRGADGINEYHVSKGSKATITTAATLDVSGKPCPTPVIEASRVLGRMLWGQVVKLVSTCPASRDEIGAWCAATGNVLLQSQQTHPGQWTFFLRKGGAQ